MNEALEICRICIGTLLSRTSTKDQQAETSEYQNDQNEEQVKRENTCPWSWKIFDKLVIPRLKDKWLQEEILNHQHPKVGKNKLFAGMHYLGFSFVIFRRYSTIFLQF